MNQVYLYLQQIMMKCSSNMVITRKDALSIISRNFKFASVINKDLKNDMKKVLNRSILNNMIELKLLKSLNKIKTKKLKIININRSQNVDKGVLADILTVGKQ